MKLFTFSFFVISWAKIIDIFFFKSALKTLKNTSLCSVFLKVFSPTRKCQLFLYACVCFAPLSLLSQQNINFNNVLIEGTIKNEKNGNLLPDAIVTVYDDRMKVALSHVVTDENGHYKIVVPKKDRYAIEAKKSTYFRNEKIVSFEEASQINDLAIQNKPGYILDITTFDKTQIHTPINSLPECKVEIYNNTTKEQELTIASNPKSVFNFPFNEGNHYTVLVRKPGYINQRIEAYVGTNGCIMCLNGIGVERPDVTALMSHNNELGYFLGNIDLDSIRIGKKFAIPNIYYDFDKSYIRADAAKVLDKLAVFLKDNPAVKVELGSHTDVRGSDKYNLSLSDRRAESAVQYLVDHHGINRDNITWKGYGETEILYACAGGQTCDESIHQMNRRTELKITGVTDEDPLWKHSLKEIIEDKDLYQKIIKLEKEAKRISGTNYRK
jgi:outer membrane protein OmpA-like peptidoglycan-associated protein